MNYLNEPHNPDLTSWVESANQKDCDFPVQNLPFAVFRRRGSHESFRVGIAIGDQVIDLQLLNDANIFEGGDQQAVQACAGLDLNEFMGMGPDVWSSFRQVMSQALRTGSQHQSTMETCLVSQDDVEYKLPCQIGDYTDFYTSVHHANRVGSLFRPDNPLLPNYKWVPIGYHGRASSIDVSGQHFHRPKGQLKALDSDTPNFGPCQRLDHELEVGIFIGSGNSLGDAISIEEAERHVFGLCLLNDWSARDIQAWEYQPLGPFLSKSFATTISPWIVTMEALAPYREPFQRPADDPQPLPYLSSDNNSSYGSLNIQLQVFLQTPKMHTEQQSAELLSCSNFKDSYWTIAQMVAHHTVNGCNLRSGDLFGSGTQSGPKLEESGSLLELTRGGKQSIKFGNGESRTFIEDGDTLVMRGRCEKAGAASIGFGQVTSTVLPAKT